MKELLNRRFSKKITELKENTFRIELHYESLKLKREKDYFIFRKLFS